MARPRTQETPPAVPLTTDRSMRRLGFARRVVFFSLCVVPVMTLGFTTIQVLGNAANGVPEGVLLLPLGTDEPWAAALALLPALPLAWLSLRLIEIRMGRSAATRVKATLHSSFALVVTLVALLDVDLWSLTVAALWWSVAALVAPLRWTVGYALVLLAVPGVRLVFYPDPNPLLMAVVVGYACVMGGLFWICNLAVLWLWEIAQEATLAREAQARLAVSEERLRFARDMHDLLGHSLSGIAVTSELAARLVERDPQRAAAEMAAVQRIAREALREVRAAVSGYRDVDLAEELASVRSVLDAAGTRTTVTGAPPTLPTGLRSLVAWIVREGATNVLRHSDARGCAITLADRGRAVVVEVYNDGAPPQAAPPFGNGLTGLAERVAAVGGTFSAAGTGDGGFLLRAVLPVRRAAPRAGGARAEVAA